MGQYATSGAKKVKEVRPDVKCSINDVLVIGSGLCVVALSIGVVSFYSFANGDHLYDLNT